MTREHQSSVRSRTLASAAVAAAVVCATAIPAGAADGWTQLGDGFTSPLGLAVGDDGTLYVGEAFIGQLTAINKAGVRRTLAQAPEGSFLPGVEATGRGTVTYTVTLPPEFQDGPPAGTTLNRVLPNGKATVLASMSGYEADHNPDAGNSYGFVGVEQSCLDQLPTGPDAPPQPQPYPGLIDSDPYKIAIDFDGSRLVADSAGNDLLRVASNGQITTVAVFAPIPQGPLPAEALAELGLPDCLAGTSYYSEPVPTDVEIGPDGNYYVTTLPGGPELPGFATVYRVSRATGAISPIVTGLSSAVDLAIDRDGTIYVAELFGNSIAVIKSGAVVDRIPLDSPGAVEIRGRTLYATASVFGNGTVVTRAL